MSIPNQNPIARWSLRVSGSFLILVLYVWKTASPGHCALRWGYVISLAYSQVSGDVSRPKPFTAGT